MTDSDEDGYGRSVHDHHAIDYIEFTVTDLAQAKRFYAAAFGWEFNDYGPEYAGIKGPQREAGGLAVGPQVDRGGPLVILFSEALEASVEAVEQAGGRITKPVFSFPGGRRFHFTDPSGNELAVWSEG
ncbi:MAG: VOC family protein [Deltaproteobacteria bacterium]|nr:VOC family protein [Deltaproteobacteria bacterium]